MYLAYTPLFPLRLPLHHLLPLPTPSPYSKSSVKPPKPVKPEGSTPADRRKGLYQKFYRQVQEERKPPDCVVVSVASQCLWVLTTSPDQKQFKQTTGQLKHAGLYCLYLAASHWNNADGAHLIVHVFISSTSSFWLGWNDADLYAVVSAICKCLLSGRSHHII